MFYWLRGYRKSSPRQGNRHGNRIRLALESLEARDCPAAPQIMTFNASVLQGHTVLLSGTVMDENPSSVSITFSGVASGSTTANAQGQFQLQTTASQLGSVYAQALDNEQLTSTSVQRTLTCPAPTLTLNLAYNSGKSVTLSGQVTANTNANLTVTFSGQVTGTTVTNSSGGYSKTADASALGTVSAYVVDVWGQQSSTVQVTIASNAPSIVNFTATNNGGNVWTIEGQVQDESAPGLIVHLSSAIPALASVDVTVGNDGWFVYTVQLQPGDSGGVSAVTTDWWGLTSNTAVDTIL